jgi:DNA replication and repair protein RecF
METLELGSGIHFIIGSNGEGKTNFLESIYVLALAKSYKTSDQVLIKHQAEFAKIEATVFENNRLYDLSMIITEDGKNALVNKVQQKRLSDYIGKLKIVSFLPEDMNLIKGSPRDRRYFFDVYLGQMNRNYLNDLSKYKYVLKQRNELLKKMSKSAHPDELLLDVITSQLANAALPIIESRKQFIEQVNHFLKNRYSMFSSKNEPFEIKYLPSVEEPVETFFKSKYKSDIFSNTTNYGPHRDDYEFFLNDVLAKNYASQGEQRTMILTLDMAMAEMMKQMHNENPVILLDDVFSELDYDKQNKLIQYLHTMQAQSIITTTSIHEISNNVLKEALVYRVTNGAIKEEKHNG